MILSLRFFVLLNFLKILLIDLAKRKSARDVVKG